MISKIHEAILSLNYIKIDSNVPFITLFAQFDISRAKVIQVINCEKEIMLTVEQYVIFCKKAREHICNRGFEDIDFLSLIVTDNLSEARKFVINDNSCWIYNLNTFSLAVYDNEPDDFYGIRPVLEGIAGDGKAGAAVSDKEFEGGNYSGYYKSTPAGTRSFIEELTPVNTFFVAVNIIVFIWMSVIGSTEDVEFMIEHGTMFTPVILENNEWYRLFTCTFQHFGFMHLAGNMVVLLFLGDNVERALGRVKYFILYICAGLIGSAGSLLYAYFYNPGIVSAGASGAIFGIIGALLWLVVRNKGRLEDMTTLRVCVLIAYAIYNGLTGENVDMAAHLFGLAGGFLLAVLLYRKKIPNGSLS